MPESFNQRRFPFVVTPLSELNGLSVFNIGTEITTKKFGMGSIVGQPLPYDFDHIEGGKTVYKTAGIGSIEKKGVVRVLPKGTEF